MRNRLALAIYNILSEVRLLQKAATACTIRFLSMEGQTETPSKTKNFVWIDEETALLLKTSLGLDWETVDTRTLQIALFGNTQRKTPRSFPTQMTKPPLQKTDLQQKLRK